MYNKVENGEQCPQTEERVGTVPAYPQHYPSDVSMSQSVWVYASVCLFLCVLKSWAEATQVGGAERRLVLRFRTNTWRLSFITKRPPWQMLIVIFLPPY